MRAPTQALGARSRGGLAIGGVAVFYGASVALLFLGELLFARESAPADFGTYQIVKQSVPLIVTVGILGYDQALVREASARSALFRFDRVHLALALRSLLLGTLLGLYMVFVLGLTPRAAATLPITVFALTVTNLVSAIMRASGRATLASATQQGYRLLTGVSLIALLGVTTGETATFIMAASAVLAAVLSLAWSKRYAREHTSADERAQMRSLGRGFTVALLTLAAMDWLDQTIVAQWGSLSMSGDYAKVKLLTTYPLVAVGSIIGFLALPYFARRKNTLSITGLRALTARYAAVVCIATLTLLPVSLLLGATKIGIHMPPTLFGVLLAAGSLRLFYVLPSALLGAVATPKILLKYGAWSSTAVMTQLIVTAGLSPYGLAEAAAAGVASGTLVRIVLTFRLVHLSMPTSLV